ncbi:MAG TPA: OmpA family protein [Cellvibrio sp.]|nr:OmpA family protein [Cellvibrio sp.]
MNVFRCFKHDPVSKGMAVPWLLRVMKMIQLPWLGAFTLVFYPLPLQAQTYIAAFSDSQWKVQSSAFTCSLSHEITGFGSARLTRNGGAAEVLELKGKNQSFAGGAVRIEAIPPSWQTDSSPANLGQAQATAKALTISGSPIAAIVGHLEKGTNIIFSGSNLRVGLEARNFIPAFGSYKNCVKNLIPYTFDQLSRTVLTYNNEADELTSAAKVQLDKIVRYVKADQKVLGVIVDAHGDKQLKPEDSLALSQRQAEWVTAYLIDKGIPAGNITTRSHGDKFPIASNHNKAGQAKNRRVTVRLENAETRKELEKKITALKEAEQKASAEKAAKDKSAEGTRAPAENTVPTIDAAELEKLTEEQPLPGVRQPDAKKP